MALRSVLRLATGRRGLATVPYRIPEESYQYFKLDQRVNHDVQMEKSEMQAYFKTMVTMRRMETEAESLYKEKKIRGFLHLYNGQEAVVVGTEAILKRTDSVITAYRDHCHYVGRGGTVRACLAELMGKYEGCSKGKGGSMHMYHVKGGFYGGNGIVGAQVPVGAGLALAHQYKGDGGVCFASYGDGAANQGQVFEAYNMAKLWKLPVVFVCENNRYGMGTSIDRAASNVQFYTRGDPIPGLKVDGMNVLAVREGVRLASEYARKNGPLVLEFDTYRYSGHSMSDPGLSYRSREEVAQTRKTRDPIELVRHWLIENQWNTLEETKALEKSVRDEVQQIVQELHSSPFPPVSELTADVYVDTHS